jgi:hypothetical protein
LKKGPLVLSPKTFPLKDHEKRRGADYAQKNGFAVFNVGELKQPVFLTPCADLVILSKPRMRRVEVLRRKQGALAPFGAKPNPACRVRDLLKV